MEKFMVKEKSCLIVNGEIYGYEDPVSGFIPCQPRLIHLDDRVRRNPGPTARWIIKNGDIEEEEDTIDACIENLRSQGKENEAKDIEYRLYVAKNFLSEDPIRYPKY